LIDNKMKEKNSIKLLVLWMKKIKIQKVEEKVLNNQAISRLSEKVIVCSNKRIKA